MTLPDVVAKLDKTRRKVFKGGLEGYTARCPCTANHTHGDKDPSFAVWVSDDEHICFKCQAGCSEDEILSALGMTKEDKRLSTGTNSSTAVYIYTDAEGKYLFEKHRIGQGAGKTFRLKDKEHSNLQHLNGWAGTLYNWPKVVAAIASGETVYVNEGEKACDEMTRLGLVGTCPPVGASKDTPKWQEAHTKALSGANVVVVADRDEAGEVTGKYIAKQLSGIAKSVRIVQSAITTDKADAYDHLRAGKTPDEFVDMTGKWVKSTKPKWKTLNHVEAEPVEWVVEPLIPRHEATILAGPSSIGKSTLAQAIATCVTLGSVVNGLEFQKGRVIFLSAEQSLSRVTKPRFMALGADLSKILTMDEDDEDGIPMPFILDDKGCAELHAMAMEFKPMLIVIDTAVAYFEAARDMNKSTDVRTWMRRIIGTARACGAGVLIICHTNKSDDPDPLKRISGSGDFGAAARSALICGKDPDDPQTMAFHHCKSNVGPHGKAYGYKITDTGEFGWTGASQLTPQRMAEKPEAVETKGRKDEFFEWLCDQLLEGEKASAELEKQARADGVYSERLFRYMRQNRKDVFNNFKKGDVWWMSLKTKTDGAKDVWWDR